ncbi:hypothetical protein HDK77DRAFT_507446 [Phyllosticta capitalensis]
MILRPALPRRPHLSPLALFHPRVGGLPPAPPPHPFILQARNNASQKPPPHNSSHKPLDDDDFKSPAAKATFQKIVELNEQSKREHREHWADHLEHDDFARRLIARADAASDSAVAFSGRLIRRIEAWKLGRAHLRARVARARRDELRRRQRESLELRCWLAECEHGYGSTPLRQSAARVGRWVLGEMGVFGPKRLTVVRFMCQSILFGGAYMFVCVQWVGPLLERVGW